MWVEIEFSNLNPGTESQQRAVLKNYLQGKGIVTKQEWVDGYPQHPVVIKVN